MTYAHIAHNPFQFAPGTRRGAAGRLLKAFHRPLERWLGLAELQDIYGTVSRAPKEQFLVGSLAALNVSCPVAPEELARIPKTGPLVIVANHPFGGLDGLIASEMLQRVRPDVKVLANSLLERIPQLHETMLFVNPFGGPAATRSNLASLRRSIAHLKSGGALVIFPAGEVSHWTLRHRAVMDPPWSDTVARLVRMTEAPVLPIYFHGRNSMAFNVLGVVHPRLRTALLPRELLKRRNSRVFVDIGTPIPFSRLKSIQSDTDLTRYLRLRTCILQTRRMDKVDSPAPPNRKSPKPELAEVAPPIDRGMVMEEVAALPRESLLLESGDFAVYLASARQIPNALLEIGRLREITFRATHEGTGKSRDLDDFDQDYLHLICWQKERCEIVGAYRLGQTDTILPRRGVHGMYTRTLFRFDERLMNQMGPALELGRAFVRSEYQRSYAPLLMLWKGIGAFVANNPRYGVLFGPVSINNQYQSISRQLIMTFLRTTASSHLAGLIRASNPPRTGPLREPCMQEYSTVVRDIEEVSDLVQEIETDRKGIPVLLRQYMKLSARLLGFNIDPDFGDVLDGLILVDFRNISPKLVERFCGKEGAQRIRDYHRNRS